MFSQIVLLCRIFVPSVGSFHGRAFASTFVSRSVARGSSFVDAGLDDGSHRIRAGGLTWTGILVDTSAGQASISFRVGFDGVCIYRETTSGHHLTEEIPTDFHPEQVSRRPGFSSSAHAACVHDVSTFVSVCRPFLHDVCSVSFFLV